MLRPRHRGPAGAECAPLPDPWPAEARDALVSLLAAGRGCSGLGDARGDRRPRRLLPEWERIRLLPHASAIHRFTVDRHVVETCVEASRLIRSVARPDVLLVAALLHDIGKGGRTEHSVAGEPIARESRSGWASTVEAVDRSRCSSAGTCCCPRPPPRGPRRPRHRRRGARQGAFRGA